MGTPAEPVLSISDPQLVKESALFSFNPLLYLYFILIFHIVPYSIYRWIAFRFDWEINEKTIARHWSDIMQALSYGVILFIFGNYTKSMSWITVSAFYPSLFGYGLIAELPFAKTSLPFIRSWPVGMWIIFMIALIIILAFAAMHIYLAALLDFPFVIYYVCGLLIPLVLLKLSFVIKWETNSNRIRSTLTLFKMKLNKSHIILETTGSDHAKIGLHIHHWQIFYTLSFFTRFTHPVSQVASGIALACYMHGVCAYGYDALINDI